MKISIAYQPRPIRFLEIYQYQNWKIKLYSISIFREVVTEDNILKAKQNLNYWLSNSKLYNFKTYNIATLIIHEFKDGCFAVINWWIDENMLQNFVYLLKNGEKEFELFSHNGITTCVWEMSILWHERNAWINHVLMQSNKPDFEAYLNEQLNKN